MRVLAWEPDVEVTSGSTAMWGELGGACLSRWLATGI